MMTTCAIKVDGPVQRGPLAITSCKYSEEHEGTLEEAIARAKELDEEYQPAWGTQVVDQNGFVHFSTDEIDNA